MSEQQHDAGPKTNVAVIKPPVNASPVQRLSGAIAGRMDAFSQVATKYLTADRLVKLAQVVVSRKPELADCSTLSVLESLMTCARLGLEPNEPGGVWLVPFKGNCTPIIDYRGLIDVCRRSGDILAVHADIRFDKDRWEYSIDTTGPTMVSLKHSPADGDRGKMLGAFFVVKLRGGECQATYLSTEQIDKFRERSKADRAGFSPWKTDYMAMAIKTVCRRGVNLLPRTPELQVLRAELQREDQDDQDPVIGDLTEGSQDAVDRMLAKIGEDDKAASDAIVAGFKALDYGPAKQLQLVTKNLDDPQALVKWLLAEQDKRVQAAKPVTSSLPATQTAAPAIPAATVATVPDQPKKKGGRPKKETKPAQPDTTPAPAEPIRPTAETKPAQAEPPKPPARPAW
jgi:phage RecT family recombinase